MRPYNNSNSRSRRATATTTGRKRQLHSYDNWEEETATKKKKLLEKQTLPFGEFSAVSHRP
jgi:hypothetical protein